MLLRLRDGNIFHNDWQMLLQRSSLQVENSDFVDAIRLFYDRESVMKFKLHTLGKPIALIKAIHSNATAANVKSDDEGGLYPIIFIAKGAHVMLTADLWPEVGLCNGASGIVHELLYQEGQAPPNLPISVLVAFDNYSGPAFLNEFPNHQLPLNDTQEHNVSHDNKYCFSCGMQLPYTRVKARHWIKWLLT